jgi:hypothetical protein
LPRRFLALTLVAVLLAAACNGGDPEAAPTTLAPAPAPTAAVTTARTVPASPLLDTMAPLVIQIETMKAPELKPIFEDFVRAEQSVMKAAVAPVDPDDPDVAARHTGERLTRTKQSLAGLKDRSQSLGVPTKFFVEPRNVSAKNDRAIVFYACVIRDQPMVESTTGKLVESLKEDELVAIGMQLVDGRWQVNLRSQKPEWEGKSCAEALLTFSSSAQQ